MKIILHIWRQRNADDKGRMARYEVPNVKSTCRSWKCWTSQRGPHRQGRRAVAFDHDCREGICGMCGSMVNGVAHGRSPAPRSVSFTAVLQGR